MAQIFYALLLIATFSLRVWRGMQTKMLQARQVDHSEQVYTAKQCTF